ncbi:MAG: carbonic anhydrase [Syntrophobacteraceae bacterium]
MKSAKIWIAALSIVITIAFAAWASTEHAPSGPSPDQAMKMLQDGNARYVKNAPKHPDADAKRRKLTESKGQHPFATVLACSDSRVPVEILFDCGIGDIFVVRVAGNVSDTDEIGSIEYGADHLGTPIVVVLGHTKCGAVTAVVQQAAVHGSIPKLVDNITPAVEKVKASEPNLSGDALIAAAIKANVWESIQDLLKNSEAVRNRVKAGSLKVVGAIYDLGNGKVEWLGQHPEQEKLLSEAIPETEHK